MEAESHPDRNLPRSSCVGHSFLWRGSWRPRQDTQGPSPARPAGVCPVPTGVGAHVLMTGHKGAVEDNAQHLLGHLGVATSGPPVSPSAERASAGRAGPLGGAYAIAIDRAGDVPDGEQRAPRPRSKFSFQLIREQELRPQTWKGASGTQAKGGGGQCAPGGGHHACVKRQTAGLGATSPIGQQI